jgi:hypothetical protein
MKRADDRADDTALQSAWYMTRGTRYAVVVLFAIMMGVGVVNLLFTTHYVNANNHKFCEVIKGFVATQVAKPTDPQAKSAQATSYMWYQRFLVLNRGLGC